MNQEEKVITNNITLENIYTFVKNHEHIPPDVAKNQKRNYEDQNTWDGYLSICQKTLLQVPNLSGWYAWINGKNKQNPFVYIGKAEVIKNSRKLFKEYVDATRDSFQGVPARLFEELHDERAAFWGTMHSHEKVLAKAISQHTKYKEVNEYLLANKINISHIVWLGVIPSNENQSLHPSSLDVRIVEKFLIAHYKPTANRDKFIGFDEKPHLYELQKALVKEVSGKLQGQVSSIIEHQNIL